MNWPQFATAALGIFAMIAGGILKGTDAAGALIASGAALTGLAMPWPKRANNNNSIKPPPG